MTTSGGLEKFTTGKSAKREVKFATRRGKVYDEHEDSEPELRAQERSIKVTGLSDD